MEVSVTTSPSAPVKKADRMGDIFFRLHRAVVDFFPNALFGFDVFVSYGRADGRTYADALVIALQKRGYRCFIDHEAMSSGQKLRETVALNLRHSRVLILIATEKALNSPFVQQEVEEFERTRRPIISISLAGSLQAHIGASPLRDILADRIWVDDSHPASETELSAGVVAEITRAFSFVRRGRVRQLVIVSAFMILAATAAVAIWQRQVAIGRQRQAEITLARSDLVQGLRWVSQDQAGKGMAYMARSLLLEPDRVATAIRLQSLLTQRSLPQPVAFTSTLRQSVIFLIHSPDGRYLAAASLNELLVWDVSTGRLIRPPFEHQLNNTHVEFSHDSRWLALSYGYGSTGGTYGFVQLFDLRKPELPPREIKFEGMLWTVRFTADDASIVTSTAFGITSWNVADGSRTGPELRFKDVVKRVPDVSVADNSFSDIAPIDDDDGWVFVYGTMNGLMGRWNRASGAVEAVQPLPFVAARLSTLPNSGKVLMHFPNNYLEFFSLGNTPRQGLAVVVDGHDFETGSSPMSVPELFADARLLPSGKMIFGGTKDGGLHLWRADGQPMRFDGRHQEAVTSIDVTNNVLVASSSADGTVRVWNALEAQAQTEALVHSGPVTAVSFDPSARFLATATSTGQVSRWVVGPRGALPLMVENSGVADAAVLGSGGDRMVVHSQDGNLVVWDTQSGKALFSDSVPGEVSLSAPGIQGVIVVSQGQRFRLLSLEKLAYTTDWVDVGSPITQVSIDQGHGRSLTATEKGSVGIWDLLDGRQVGRTLAHDGEVHSAVFLPDGSVITASGKTIAVWDVTSGKRLRSAQNTVPGRYGEAVDFPNTKQLKYSASDVIDLRVAQGGERVLALYGYSGMNVDVERIRGRYVPDQAVIWDVKSLRPSAPLGAGRGTLTTVELSADGKLAGLGSFDGVVKIWAMKDGTPVATLNHSFPVKLLAFGDDGTSLVVAGKSEHVSIWRSLGEDARPTTIQASGQVRRLLGWRGAKAFLTLSEGGQAQAWDAVSGEPITDPLIAADEAERLLLDPDAAKIVVLDGAGRAYVWHFPIPATLKQRCALSLAAEQFGGYTLSANDLPVPTSLVRDGGYASRTCPTEVFDALGDDALRKWILTNSSDRTISPWAPVSTTNVVKDVAGSARGQALLWGLFMRDPADDCARTELVKLLRGSSDEQLRSIAEVIEGQAGSPGGDQGCQASH